MRCIAANRSILTAIDQNTTLADYEGSNCTAMTNDIDSMDTIQFADGWYSYPDLNTFDSDFLLDVLTNRVRIISFLLVFLLLFLCRILNQQKSYLHGMSKQIIPLLFLLLKWVGD
jgi:hypothetical protein